MYNVLKTPIFGIIVSVVFFNMGLYINRKTKNPLCNPLLIAIAGIIIFLMAFKIPYKSYNIGGSTINYFLGPVTVVLAIPLYKQFELLKKNIGPILIGITGGVLTSAGSTILTCKLLNSKTVILSSLLPKSITTPMGISLSNTLGGIQSITVVSIIITGIVGATLAPMVLKVAKITNPVAKGISMGTAAHALATSKAIEMGEVEGAMSGLSIAISGLITVIVVPIIVNFI